MTIRAVIFDRDGVLTDFDGLAAYNFFSPLLPIPIEKLNDYWFLWGDMRRPGLNMLVCIDLFLKGIQSFGTDALSMS